MPQPCFHLQIAETLLQRWSAHSAASPFPPSDPTNRFAFLHGSVAPDMGFFPGTPQLLAELAHLSRTADLTREILRLAQSDAQMAFALGWFSHILLDALVHPIVNSTARDLLGPATDHSRAEHDHMHIRLEIGLDLAVHRQHSQMRRLRLPALFNRDDLRFLGRALAEIHGVSILPNVLATSHRRVAFFTAPLLTLQATMSACVPPITAPVPFVHSVKLGLGTLQNVAAYVGGPANWTLAFLSPVNPPEAFARAVDRAVAQFHVEFQRHIDQGLAFLPNYNLDTGEIEEVALPVAVTAVA